MLGFLLQTMRTVRMFGRVLADPRGRTLASMAGVQLLLGTVFYSVVEGWRWIDGLYFSVTTLATVGLGDLAPVTDAGKLFTVMYIITGVGLIAAFMAYLAERATDRS